jgi:hypothetical protein
MAEHVLSLGYWYQRTSLHLSEIYDFLLDGTSPLSLDKDKLLLLQESLELKEVAFKVDVLEYIEIQTTNGITITFYEDGLVMMQKQFKTIAEGKQQLAEYYEKQFAPAIHYLFSLGAPVPRELAKTKDRYTYFLVTQHADHKVIEELLKDLGEKEYYEFSNADVAIYRGEKDFVINNKKHFEDIDKLIEMFIFFSEFKAQLHQYLNLHRVVWEKIAKIKEQGHIRGKDLEKQRHELESYKKTIDLIDGRMEQMGLYIGTRSSMVKESGWEKVMTNVLAFKYENLQHTLAYVKSLWHMTRQYVDSAIQLFNEINQVSTKYAVNALTIISSIGIVSLMITTLGRNDLPQPSWIGLIYVAVFLGVSFLINQLITFVFNALQYKISDTEYKKDLSA